MRSKDFVCTVNTEACQCISVRSKDFVCTVNTFMNTVMLHDSVFAFCKYDGVHSRRHYEAIIENTRLTNAEGSN